MDLARKRHEVTQPSDLVMMMPSPLEAPDQSESEGQVVDSPIPAPKSRPRRRKVTAGGGGHGHKRAEPDGVFERLQLTALKRRSTASAIAAGILDRNLPKSRIESED